MKPLDIQKNAKGGGGAAKEEGRMQKAEPIAPAAPVAKGKPGRKPKTVSAPVASTDAMLAGKPDTLAGAMKFTAKQLKTFTRAQLEDALNADADFKALLENSSAAAMTFNLKYWSDRNRLKKTGDEADATYTVVDLDF
jgi:hypothetical protein